MEHILNLLTLTADECAAFERAAQGHEQRFISGGRKEDGSPVTAEDCRWATAILGNPPPEALSGCQSLRWLQTRSAGTDQYQRPGVLPKGARLTSASGAYGHSVSEHMLAMLLSAMKRLPGYQALQREGRWTDLGQVKSLAGAQVLCVGTGDLGSSFARLCKALGAHTIGIRRDVSKAAEGIDKMYAIAELDQLLPQADVVALNLPHADDTVRLIDRRRMLLMKKDAILLNAGRGSTVDCEALAQVLKEGHLWAACLDVTDPEPLPTGHPLWQQGRAMITPHAAGGNHLPDTAGRIAAISLKNLKKFLAGQL